MFLTCMALLFLLVTVLPAAAQFDRVLKGLGSFSGGNGLSDAKIGSGLQEALKVGTENAVAQTGTVDGFLKNQAIKILMPKSLQTMKSLCVLSATDRRSMSSSSG